jgi:hypothetical protein
MSSRRTDRTSEYENNEYEDNENEDNDMNINLHK